jgi:pimeloyl-ACP methyl ester carboxylesterase
MNDSRLIHVGTRVIRVRSLGAGTPVVYAHGAPGSILEQPVSEAVLSKLGVRLVLIERPGFGASSRHEERTLATWVDDLRVVLEELGLQRVSVLGWAAGVPYALAAAALAPDRVASLSLVGPWWFLEGETQDVDPSSPSAVAACRDELSRVVAPVMQLHAQGAGALLDAILAQMPEPDRHLSPETRAMLAASCAEALRQGAEPAIDEGLVIRLRWPFTLDDIACDAEVWSGDADVRAGPSLRLLSQRLPRARQVVLAGGGHYLVFTHGETILSSLASGRT